jgi:exopolysaccharide biosynthesis predicted pyruvyltransferase EpsI
MTDRLHVAIASSLMGKEVHLYAGSYFKNKEVFLSTLKEYFPNVLFHDN